MKEAQKPSDESLAALIHRLSEGRFEIPNFQRKFVWKAEQINDLMRSIFCDYYIGNLLLWKGVDENFTSLSCEPISGYKGSRHKREHIVLDGQQRLSAIYYALFAPNESVPKRKSRGFFYIYIDRFMEEEFKDAFEYRLARKRPFARPEEQYQNRCFPLSILGDEPRMKFDWFQEYGKHWKLQEMDASEAGNDRDAEQYRRYQDYGEQFEGIIDETLRDYTISYTELDRNIGIGKICSIFTKINSTGTRLDIFNLLNAMLTPKEIYLKQMWDDASPRLEFVKAPRLNTYVLQVMSILRQQGYCSPNYLYHLVPGSNRLIRDATGAFRHEVQVVDKDDFMQRWHEAIRAIEQAINLLSHPQEFGAITSKFLPYPAITPAFAALQASARQQDASIRMDALHKVRLWYWASVFTERYSRAVESRTARDYREVCTWIDGGDAPDVISDFPKAVQSLDLRGTTSQSSAVYRGVIDLVVLRGSSDWISGDRPNAKDIDDHHIVPRSWGRKHALGSDIDTVLNRTPLSSETNRKVIRDRLPNEYLPELITQRGEKSVRLIFESHLISHDAFEILRRDPFTRKDFDEFIAERQRTIRSAINRLLIEERFDLAPDLRALAEAIKNIELALRYCINETLIGSTDDIKGLHFFPKVQERVETDLRGNPALNPDHYTTLAGNLEYFDLRDLEDTIKSKVLWERFQEQFRNKEELANRFQQLANLRNTIAHARSADELTRADGEAAILWFRAVLDLED